MQSFTETFESVSRFSAYIFAISRSQRINSRLLLFLSRPAQSSRHRLDKIKMVATAIYSVTMLFCGKKRHFLFGEPWRGAGKGMVSSVTVVIRLPISCMSSMAISCHVYQLSLWQMGRRCLCWPIWSICLSCSVLFYYYYYFLTPFPGNEKNYAMQYKKYYYQLCHSLLNLTVKTTVRSVPF